MDESQSLEAVASVLNEIAEKPLDIALHLRHIQLTSNLDHDSHISALQMMSDLVAAGDEVWVLLLEEKEKSVNLNTEEGVNELLQVYDRAEGDYLSIPILQKHIKFILDGHARYSEEPKPDSLGDAFSTSWTMQHVQAVVSKGISHLSKSRLLFDAQRDWLFEQLETASSEDRATLIDHFEGILNIRLKQPHSNSDETFQAYSSFTTKFKSPSQYEGLMVSASKTRGSAVKSYERRDPLESTVTQTSNSLDSFARYIVYERRARNPDVLATRGIYERAIAEAASRRHKGEQGAEQALDSFWTGYLDAMRIQAVGIGVESELYGRALRSVPGSGEVWARYIRFLESVGGGAGGRQSVADAYDRAMSSGLLQSDVEKIVSVALAYASWAVRTLESDDSGEDLSGLLCNTVKTLEDALESVHKISKAGDPKFRLEKMLAGIHTRFNDPLDNGLRAAQVWQVASENYGSSYVPWLKYTDALIQNEQYQSAHEVFEEAHTERMDWPEAIWEAWLSFEHIHGSVQTINDCMDSIEKASARINAFRAKELEKAYQTQANQYPPAETGKQVAASPMNVDAPAPESSSMDIDTPTASESKKRTADDEDRPTEGGKRARFEPNPATLKRDRENTTVFVAGLPSGITEAELKALFKDCGGIREVKITTLPSTIVALVEFYARDSVPAALTKDKKRLHDQEIAVHLAWKSTLYVTNFPESADDAYVRTLFGKYGTIFDVRWPSKKFKNTRRFCYVQYTSPDAAQQALGLHGTKLEPKLPLSVYISNPERKKERTDHDANEREVYIAGLNRYTNKADLEKLFATYGPVKDVRIATDQDGHARGYAFIEYEDPQDARRALEANNHELKKRTIAVTLADPRVRARHTKSDTGLGRTAEVNSRSVRVRNVPPNTQEGLLQQVFEKVAAVRRVEFFADKNEAVIELETAAEAGKLLLRAEPVVFNGTELELVEEGKAGAATRSAAPPPKSGSMFVPRRAGNPRPKAGLGHPRAPPTPSAATPVAGPSTSASTGANKGQDDFRKMLAGRRK